MRATKIIVVIVVLAVAVVCVAPFVNLEPTVLNSVQAVFALIAGLASVAVFRFGVMSLSLLRQTIVQSSHPLSRSSDVLDLICSRLC